MLALQAGAKPVLVPRFTVDALKRGLDAGATILGGVPSMYRTILADPTFSAPSLRMILTGGEVLPKPLAVAMQAMSPRAEIFDLYGLTETGSCDFVLKPADQPEGLGSIGVPTDQVSYRIGDDGELQIRTPFGMLGYLDNPALTADSFHGDYFKTGDLARIQTGRPRRTDRAREGHRVARRHQDRAARNRQSALRASGRRRGALCAGVPDERLGETIHAAIVKRSWPAGRRSGAARVPARAHRALQNSGCLLFLRRPARRTDRQGRSPRGRATSTARASSTARRECRAPRRPSAA